MKGVRTPEERRLRRDARREKQRLANIGRAAKMHAARLDWDAADSPSNPQEQLSHSVRIGCSGWFYWGWRDCFYPVDMPTKDWFSHYAGQFRTVELNAPFYSWPTLATVQSWIRQARGNEFVYTVKVSELITHVKRFTGTKTLVKDFCHIADRLGPGMGCFLFQLPPSFHYTPTRLNRILSQLDPRRKNAIEFRHASWWNERVYQSFRSSGTIFCSVSAPKLPDEFVTTADDVYIRFHGTQRWYRHDYTPAELAVWAGRIRSGSARQVWVYFNNDYEGFAIKNARELSRMMECG